MARKVDNNSKITYLKINGDGILYETSKEPKDGFKKVEYVDKQTKDTKVTYHNLYNGGTDIGKVSYLDIRETNFGKVFSISIKSDNGIDAIQIPVFNAKGRLTPYVKNLATLLPNLDFKRSISIVPSTKKDSNGYTDKTIFINYEDGDKGFVKFAHRYGDNGDIPKAENTEGIDGSVKYDFEKQDKFLYNSLLKSIERFKLYESGGAQQAEAHSDNTNSQELPDNQKVVEHVIHNDESDDLPF